MNLKSILVCIVICFTTLISTAQIVFPFHLVNGYILIEGEVNNTKGKFIFDTGTPLDFMINDNLVNLSKDNFLSTGKAGSGQVLSVYKSAIDNITIAKSQLQFKKLINVTHTNFSFMQDSIASDILGTIGYGIIKKYVVTIDYNRQIINLDTKPKDRTDLKKVAIFYFENDTILPEITFTTSNGMKIKAYFDTGSQGVMKINEALLKELIQNNTATIYSSAYSYGYAIDGVKAFSLKNLMYNDVTFDLKNLTYYLDNQNKIALGYSFLKDYISVWDFTNKSLTIYKE